MGKKRDIKIVKEFKERLAKVILLKKLILFGSRVNGKVHRWSDFDLIVVSKDFEGQKTFKRGIGFYNYWKADSPVDFLCYTPKEFDRLKKKVTIAREAMREGIEI